LLLNNKKKSGLIWKIVGLANQFLNFLTTISQRPFIKKLAGGIFTQSLLSVTNFIVGILIARQTSKDDYGIYVMAFSTIMIAISFQNALVNSPLTVLFPEKNDEKKNILISGLGFGQWIIFLPIFLLIFVGMAIFEYFQKGINLNINLIIILFVIVFGLHREFLRVLNYCYLKIYNVVIMDSTYVVITLSGIFILQYYGRINGLIAIAIIGIAYLISFTIGHALIKTSFHFNLNWIKNTYKETWQYSKWILIGVISSNIKNYGYIYIISLILSLKETADVSAASLFLKPFGLFIASSQRIFLSKGAHIVHEKNIVKLKKFIWLFIALFLLCWFFWSLFLFITHEYLIENVLSSKYENISLYIFMWSVLSLLNSISFIMTNSLVIFKKFKLLAITGFISAFIMLVMCIILCNIMGSIGALFSLGLGNIIYLILTIPILNKNLKKLSLLGTLK